MSLDFVLPFQLETTLLRGRLVKLGPSLNEIMRQHTYPDPIAGVVAESLAVASALATSLSYEGTFTFQIKSDGQLSLLVADITHEGAVRAYARYQNTLSTDTPHSPLIGQGQLTFTVDRSPNRDLYQGVVNLQGANLAEAIQHYFRQSEQIPTGIITATKKDDMNHWYAGCLLLQRMPREGGHQIDRQTSIDEDWYRSMMLMRSCRADELTDPRLSGEELLFRLFHEEGVRVFEPRPLQHQCRCSEKRVTSMLRSLPRSEIEALAIEGVISVNCEFCNKNYHFDQRSRDEIWTNTNQKN